MPDQMSARSMPPIPTIRASLRLFFRFASPRILGVQLALALSVRWVLADFGSLDLCILLAIALWWPFQEWLFHRFLLHAPPVEAFGRRFNAPGAKEHRAHHRKPWRLGYVFLPAKTLAPLVPLHLAFWWAITPDLRSMCTGLAAFTAATLLYEWVHFIVHVPYRPRTAWLKRVSRNHRLHHFKNEHYWFAFTVPRIDTILRTDPDPKAVSKSPTVRTLGVADEQV
jgi:hypothetical protein